MKRSKKLRMLVSALAVTLVMGAAHIGIPATRTLAAAGTIPNIEPTVPKAVLADTLKPYKVKPGDTVEVIIPVRASNYVIRKPIIEVDLSHTNGFKLASNVVHYTKESNNPSSITVTETSFVKFSVYIPMNAKKGYYNNIPISFLTTDSFNNYAKVDLEQVSKLTFVIEEQKKLAEFSLVGSEIPSEVKEEENFSLGFRFINKGELTAKNATVTLKGYENFFRLDDSQPTVKIGDVLSGATSEATFDLISAKNLATTLIQLTAQVKYENEDGTAEEPQDFIISIQAIGKEEKSSPIERPIIQVTKVDYPRYTIRPEQKFDITYTFTNTGKVDVRNLVIDLTGYSEAGFKPAKAYDKKRVKLLKVGKSVTYHLELQAMENLQTGMKPIIANFSYFSAEDKALATQISDSINIYLDAKAKEDEKGNDLNNSVPRLMISKYETGEEKIMAGKVFQFNFDVLNTHNTASADNIKATVLSTDGNFAIVEGSASFYISSLKAGEVKSLKIPLKVKGDIATNGYDLSVKFEYEYLKKDAANNNNLTKQTTELTEVLKLQVFSNDRPMLSNINVGDGEPPKHMESTSVTFDFNNLGKSPLYNVTAKVSGDFVTQKELLIIGNVNPGDGKSWSMEVTPMVESFGTGVLTISYEDGNGNVKTYDTKFESEIMMADSGMQDSPTVPIPPMMEEKKDLMPWWAFAIIQAVVFLVVAMITRGVLIKKYKKKKRAEIEKEDEEL